MTYGFMAGTGIQTVRANVTPRLRAIVSIVLSPSVRGFHCALITGMVLGIKWQVLLQQNSQHYFGRFKPKAQ